MSDIQNVGPSFWPTVDIYKVVEVILDFKLSP